MSKRRTLYTRRNRNESPYMGPLKKFHDEETARQRRRREAKLAKKLQKKEK